jgi:hypothetical protein
VPRFVSLTEARWLWRGRRCRQRQRRFHPSSGSGGTFDFNAIDNASWWSSTAYYTDPLDGSIGSAAAIGFHLQVNENWTGTFFIDDVEIY